MVRSLRLSFVILWGLAITKLVPGKLIRSSLDDHSTTQNRRDNPHASTVAMRKLDEDEGVDDKAYNDSTQAPDAATDDETDDDGAVDNGDESTDDTGNELTDDAAEIQGADDEEQVDGADDSPQSDETDDYDDGAKVVSFGITDMYNTPPGDWDAFDWFVVASVLAAWGFICIWVWSVIQQCRRWCCPKKASFDDTKADVSDLSSYYSRHS